MDAKLSSALSVAAIMVLVTSIERHMANEDIMSQSDWARLIEEADAQFPVKPEPEAEDWLLK